MSTAVEPVVDPHSNTVAFPALSPADLAALRPLGKICHYDDGDVVFRAGDADIDMFVVESGGIDLLFANEDEVLQLVGRTDLDAALEELTTKVPTLVVTRGAAGATGLASGERVNVPAAPVREVVDTTGAGDLFAAGFVAAHARGASLEPCLYTGPIAAGEVIQHFGARPVQDLKQLVAL